MFSSTSKKPPMEVIEAEQREIQVMKTSKMTARSRRVKSFAALAVPALAVAGLLALPAAADADKISKNMKLVGHNDLQARSAYQPIITAQDGRYIAYVGHHNGSALNPLTGMVETNGVSIVDVTDPANPVYLHHIEGAAGAQMVRTCSGDDLPDGIAGKTYLLRTDGNIAHIVEDVTDPANPVQVSIVVDGLGGTHKTWWECDTGIAYLASGVPGWRTNRMTQIFDLSDPANPVFIRNFGLDGQQPGSTIEPVPTSLHGCISMHPERNRVYCGHGTNANGILVILDRDVLLDAGSLGDPANPTADELAAPVVSRLFTPSSSGAHTTFPVLDVEIPSLADDPTGGVHDYVVLVNESLRNECSQNETDPARIEGRQRAYLVDITDEAHPFPVSNLDVREADGDFCNAGGRFGSHSSNESMTPPYYKKMVFVAWFNAGVRAFDIRDPVNPREVAYFIPEITANTAPRDGKIAIQTNNVEVDDNGFIYTADRANTGLHIFELKGKAREIIFGDDDDDDEDDDDDDDDDD